MVCYILFWGFIPFKKVCFLFWDVVFLQTLTWVLTAVDVGLCRNLRSVSGFHMTYSTNSVCGLQNIVSKLLVHCSTLLTQSLITLITNVFCILRHLQKKLLKKSTLLYALKMLHIMRKIAPATLKDQHYCDAPDSTKTVSYRGIRWKHLLSRPMQDVLQNLLLQV